MLDQLLRLFSQKKSLMAEAQAEAVRMLEQGRNMFDMVMDAMLAKANEKLLDQVRGMDKDINKVQRDVRKKVFEHMVFCRGEDIIDAIILLTVVVDLERIGDYTKNIGELVVMMPEQCCWGKKAATVEELKEKTLALFDRVYKAFKENDDGEARAAVRGYEEIAKSCEEGLREIFTASAGEEYVPREFLHMVLVLRYIKRVSAHLKNVATTVINPVDQIGFVLPEEEI